MLHGFIGIGLHHGMLWKAVDGAISILLGSIKLRLFLPIFIISLLMMPSFVVMVVSIVMGRIASSPPASVMSVVSVMSTVTSVLLKPIWWLEVRMLMILPWLIGPLLRIGIRLIWVLIRLF
jgi:hypothetical protein